MDLRELAQTITQNDKEESTTRLRVFAEWFENEVFQSDQKESLQSIMVWPFSPQEPQYRDNYPR